MVCNTLAVTRAAAHPFEISGTRRGGGMSGAQPGLTAAGAAAAAKPRIKATVRLQHMKFMKQAAIRTQAAAAAASPQEVQISLLSQHTSYQHHSPCVQEMKWSRVAAMGALHRPTAA